MATPISAPAPLPGRAAPHRVLILGGGFAGIQTAQVLEKRLRRRTDVEIWVVSR